jgi:hypothetical protein
MVAAYVVCSTTSFAGAKRPSERGDSLSALRGEIENMRRQQQIATEDLWDRIDALEEALLEVREHAQRLGSQQRPNIFNPGITVFGNFLGRLDDGEVFIEEHGGGHEGEGPVAIDDKFNLREVELDFRGVIDPWADGVVIVAFESETPRDTHIEIEEGYVVLKKLPVLDRAPLGLKLKAGRFRNQFGRFNVIHTHDLPQMTRPRSITTFLGEEGLIRNGVSAQVFVPTPGDNFALETTVEAVNDGGLPYSHEAAGKGAYLGRLTSFWDMASGHDLALGLSGLIEDSQAVADFDLRLYGVDLTYKWKPFADGEWKSFLLGGELFLADLPEENDSFAGDMPMGFYVWSQAQFNRNLYVGVRYDQTDIARGDHEDGDGDRGELQALGAYVTYYTTEFLRFRLGYEHSGERIGEEDNLNSVLLELNFIFGSHPVEPYWVNR